MKNLKTFCISSCAAAFLFTLIAGCSIKGQKTALIQTVSGPKVVNQQQLWLTHEHILVDFIGADSIQPSTQRHPAIVNTISPHLESAKKFDVELFVDATPNYLGREVALLQNISRKTGLHIITNTGLYGARDSKFIPEFAKKMSAQTLANMWINEFENGINGSSIKPGFIKIGVDSSNPLDPLHEKLVRAAGITSLATGMTIASHTGSAVGLWPQLAILRELGVPLESFIWVHAQQENDNNTYLEAAKTGVWISLDGIGWDTEKHSEKLQFAKQHRFLHQVLISHDAGWYDPNKATQEIKPYTDIFTKLKPSLKAQGFDQDDFDLLMRKNPLRAFSLK